MIDASAFDSAQVVYNMLNPSAAAGLPPNYPAQDYGRLLEIFSCGIFSAFALPIILPKQKNNDHLIRSNLGAFGRHSIGAISRACRAAQPRYPRLELFWAPRSNA